jgi:hypothetical protein
MRCTPRFTFPRQDRHEVVIATTAARSAVVSRSPLALPFRGVNGNSRPARRYREIATAIADDLGGSDNLGEPTKILVREATALTLARLAEETDERSPQGSGDRFEVEDVA